MSNKTILFMLASKDKDGNFTVLVNDRWGEPTLIRDTMERIKERNDQDHVYSHSQGYREGYKYYDKTNYQWVRYRDPKWREREQRRFTSGEYAHLPWVDLPLIPDHFAHVSIEDGAMVAFTATPDKGMVDLQVSMKPGRYLAKFYPGMDADKIRALACELDKACELRLATTPEDIAKVYTNGPSSCMSHPASNFNSDDHPASVYGAGDLAVAYLSSLEISNPKFKASARALVWPDKKFHDRIYGDMDRMRTILEKEGYISEDMQGARLLRIPHRGAFLGPYLDGIDSVSDDGTHLIIDRRGRYDATNTNGCIGDAEDEDDDSLSFYCPRMDQHYDPDYESTYDVVVGRNSGGILRREEWSETAADNSDYAFYCTYTSEYYDTRIFSEVTLENGETCVDWYFSDNGFICPKSDANVLNDDGIEISDLGITVSDVWANENAIYDKASNTWLAEPTQEAA